VSGIQRTLTIYITSCAVASVAAEQRSCIETQKRKQEIWFCDDAPFGHDRAFSDSLWTSQPERATRTFCSHIRTSWQAPKDSAEHKEAILADECCETKRWGWGQIKYLIQKQQ
jgi:hypothetical protein